MTKTPTERNANVLAIPLSKGHVAIVDREDYDRLMQHRWFVTSTAIKGRNVPNLYASTKVKAGEGFRNRKMHRMILNAPDGVQVDHINGDGLDNRRANLRFLKNRDNQMNRHRGWGTSDEVGVCYDKRRSAWRPTINVAGKQIYLGLFATEAQAVEAYRLARKIYWLINEASRPLP